MKKIPDEVFLSVDRQWAKNQTRICVERFVRASRPAIMTDPKRVPAEEFEPEPCAHKSCTAGTTGLQCYHDHGSGSFGCPRGPWRNADAKIEHRRAERRTPQKEELE